MQSYIKSFPCPSQHLPDSFQLAPPILYNVYQKLLLLLFFLYCYSSLFSIAVPPFSLSLSFLYHYRSLFSCFRSLFSIIIALFLNCSLYSITIAPFTQSLLLPFLYCYRYLFYIAKKVVGEI